MKNKKTPLTKDQHKKIGAVLKKMRDDLLLVVLDEVQQAYGWSNTETGFSLRAVDVIDQLRNCLADRLAEETTPAEWEREKLGAAYHPGIPMQTNQNG